MVEVVVLLAPAADHAVRRGHHDVLDQLLARDALGQGGAGQTDARAQLEDVDGAEDLVSTLSVLAMDGVAPAIVLVSHHVEEIPPGFTHVLMLREGKVVVAGPLDHVMTEDNLSRTFGMPLVVQHEAGRWAARRRTRSRARSAG